MRLDFCHFEQSQDIIYSKHVGLVPVCRFNAEIYDSPDVLKVKSDWQLEVQLDCGTLVLSANGVFDLDVNL